MEKIIELDIANRPPPLADDVRRRLCEAGTGPVSDACPEAVTIGSVLYPVGDHEPVAGTALTVAAGPADNLALWASLKFARPGDMLFVSTENCRDASVCGDLLVGFAKNCGIAALATDGCIRDLIGIRETGLPVYASGASPKAPAKRGPGTIGGPIRMAGVEILRDMVVVCDCDGIVAFECCHLEATLEALAAVQKKEAQAAREIAEERRLPTWIETMLESIRYEE